MQRLFDPISLRLFVAICEEGHIARAARREALVPSAVSKRLAALEAQVGTPLLVRARRGVAPTPAGHVLLRQSRELLAAMERMSVELSEFATGVQGSVRVAASASALAEWLPEDVAAFLARHPALRVVLDERNGAHVVRDVREGAADLGVVWDVVDAPGLQAQPYRSDHLGVVLRPDHPLATRADLRLAELLDHPLVTVTPGGLLDTLLRRQAALLGRTVSSPLHVASLEAGARIVAAGLGLAVLPYEATRAQVGASRLVIRPLAEPWAERRFAILSRGDAGMTAAARALAAHLGARA